MPGIVFLYLFCIGVASATITYVLQGARGGHTGPKGVWITGNLRDLSSGHQWRKFSEWSKVFGEIIYLKVFGHQIVILNSLSDALELMDKNGAIYSDRPRLVYIHDLLKIKSVTFMPYGSSWRMNRRLFHQYLSARALGELRTYQTMCVRELLVDLLESEDFWGEITKYSTSLILRTTYGYERSSDNGKLIEMNVSADKVIFGPGPPGATAVDVFPLLRFIPSWMPGGSLKKFAFRNRVALWEVSNRPYELVKEEWASGNARPCLLTRMLDDSKSADESHYQTIRDVCASMYRATVGTSSAIIYVFILAMLLHPHAARKAQKELDSVLQQNRLPGHEDKDSLPYIDCILKECMRWRPPAPLGMAHRAMEAGNLAGKRIHKGSIILPNIWHMMHDTKNYEGPDVFNPDRFMGNSPAMDPSIAIFGFGRRICPGRFFAESNLWLVMASILAAFDISPELDEKGREILPDSENFTPHLISFPIKFPCKFSLRISESLLHVESTQSS